MVVDRMYSRLELINIQWATVLIAFVVLCLLTINNADIARAAPGDLDLSFGSDGKVTTGIDINNNDEARALAIQSDGKIVVAGHTENNGQFDIAVVRYNANGSPDNSFSGDGIVTTDIGGNNDEARALAIQSDGKIVVAGRSGSPGLFDIAVVRYNADGSPDNSFGNSGVVTTSIGGGDDEAHAVAIQGDGKIVVAGRTQSVGPFDVAVVRYNADGSPDNSFGNSGVVTTSIGGGDDEAYGIAIQSTGEIVVVGRTQSVGPFDVAVVRYNADGSPDNSFGNSSVVTTQISSGNDEAHAVAIQSDGKIVVAGRSEQGGSFDFAVVRYNPDGSLDNSGFGINGKVTTPVGGNDDGAESIAIQSDNKIVVAGHSLIAGTDDIALVRYNTDGGQDTSFGNGGFVTTSVGISNDEAYGVAIQGDGKIVVAGLSEQSGTSDIALVRYLTATDSGGGGGNSSTNGGGGGCTLNPRGGFDFSLVSLMGLMLVYLGWKGFRRCLIK